ncbi:ubiquinone/menaquinone biosynthesis C-methyltransferase UbiE isoform X2 [Pseudoliparis swirei]|uniref:ubiquinone/menaquinone biosynthesis C-methyltransferase UbiE isoform X2 n=1 Tax=Pseudoliparis swirei TaxID=2059687 RepID=UPI0024BE19AD|nr:ubiquinone/menaquinone biosynthesis C-methyltransferase UbiE isoform X2 [Pseudoliparis swirei]
MCRVPVSAGRFDNQEKHGRAPLRGPRSRGRLLQTPNQCNLAVDVGCGSGQGTILLAPHFTKVVGTDVSPAQLEMALTNENPPNVSYRECPAETLPFACGEVDLVSAFAAAHWFDREKFLLEVDRVLRPGGCLALLSYSMDMELEYGDVPDTTLNGICKEFYTALLPFRHPHLGTSSSDIYSAMFDSCPYPDKEWTGSLKVKRSLPLSGYIGMVETFSSFQGLLQKDPSRAERLSDDTKNKLMSAMKVSSPETEVTVIVKFFYWLARKPL